MLWVKKGRVIEMSAWKYYTWERKEYLDMYNISLISCETEKILRKIKRHFKFKPQVKLFLKSRFDLNRGEASYGNFKSVITIGYTSTLGVVIHEFAHLLANEQKRKSFHDKSFRKKHKSVVTYVRARNYFGLLKKVIEASC